MIEIKNRTKIAIWGISTGIWTAVREHINNLRVEIVCFIDSDINKQGMIFHKIPIVSPEQFDENEVDYILIAAYTGMEIIRKNMINRGIPKEKIQPFLTDNICEYCIGNLDSMDWKKTLDLYWESIKLKRLVEQYIKLYSQYTCIAPLSETGSWCEGKHLIAHALGGYLDDFRKVMYSNSKEAFMTSVEKGSKLMECDVVRMADGIWYLGHGYGDLFSYEEEDFMPMSLAGFILALAKQKDIICLFDVKWDNADEYKDFVERLDDTVKLCGGVTLKQRIVLEVYNEKTIQIAYDLGYEMFFTQYRNPEWKCIMKTLTICDKYNIKAVGVDSNYFEWNNMGQYLNEMKSKGRVVYVFSTDDLDEISEYRKKGAYGVFSNYIVPAS